MFHVSMLWKYISNSSHVLEFQPVELNEDLTCKEQPVQILDRRENVFFLAPKNELTIKSIEVIPKSVLDW